MACGFKAYVASVLNAADAQIMAAIAWWTLDPSGQKAQKTLTGGESRSHQMLQLTSSMLVCMNLAFC